MALTTLTLYDWLYRLRAEITDSEGKIIFRQICSRFANCYKKIYGDKIHGIYLYGSYARGDFDEESDIDFTAIVEGDQVEFRRKR